MRQSDNDFPFGINFNFAVDNLLVQKNAEQGAPFPPVSGVMDYQDNTHMHFQDGTNMLYE